MAEIKPDQYYMIFDSGLQCWRAPGGEGYTQDMVRAAVFTRAEIDLMTLDLGRQRVMTVHEAMADAIRQKSDGMRLLDLALMMAASSTLPALSRLARQQD